MILFVDDELRRMESVVEQLEMDGLRVHTAPGVDQALAALHNDKGEIDFVILDIMMDLGSTLEHEDTEEGLRTGVHLFERIRKVKPTVPVMVLTNADDVRLEEHFSKEPRTRFFQKRSLLPQDVAPQVREMMRDDEW